MFKCDKIIFLTYQNHCHFQIKLSKFDISCKYTYIFNYLTDLALYVTTILQTDEFYMYNQCNKYIINIFLKKI